MMTSKEASKPALGETLVEGQNEPARHYGDPAAEYHFVRESVGIVDRPDLAQLKMYGRDPVRMLNGLMTNDLGSVGQEQAVYAAVLTPKGRIITDLRVLTLSNAPAELLLDVPRVALPAFREHLQKYVPPLFARWTDAATVAVGVYGPAAPEALAEVLGVMADATEDLVTRAEFAGEPIHVVGTAIAGGEKGYDLFVGSDQAADLRRRLSEQAATLGGGPVGFAVLDVLRVEAGRPRYGLDFDEQTLPAEVYEGTGLMSRAVSFTKGCYTGQEVVVRIAHRGHVNRLLRGLLLGETPPPPARTALFPEAGEKEVGFTTSAVESPRCAQAVALAFVRREIEVGSEVRVGRDGPLARVVALPF